MNTSNKRGTISAGNPSPVVVDLIGNGGGSPPYTVAFTSAGDAAFSFDGGAIYQTIAAAITAGGQKIYFINNPVTNVKFTGSNADKYQIL